ncbi:Putative speedy protein-like protein 3 [Myotis davidii]|uniref:Putative speedy protein-like protein 3 n=1 Tax=Myotis davidii TaxID=225400 RepID=L5LIP1_MYODS|nr:Putative speedy protein-like protein 3 [Myotis davidii]
MLTGSFVPADSQENGCLASSLASSKTFFKLMTWKRGQKTRWTINYFEGTKLWIKRKRSSYRPEDQEAFYRLLEDPVIQSFLEADIFLKVSDKASPQLIPTPRPRALRPSAVPRASSLTALCPQYLLSMVVEYFGRVGLPGHLYNKIHFFLALYIASDMEEDNPTAKCSIFQFLLGREHWLELYREFLGLKVKFFHAMGHQAWVTQEICEEIQARNPHHWVWGRGRQCIP